MKIKIFKAFLLLLLVQSAALSEGELIKWINWGGQGATGTDCGTFSPDSKLIVTGEPHRAVVWDATSGKIVKILGLFRFPTNSVCFSPDGLFLATGTGTTIDVWDAKTFSLHSVINERDVILELRFSYDSKVLLSVTGSPSERYAVRLWDYRTQKLLKDLSNQPFDMNTADFSPDNKFLILGTGAASDGGDPRINSALIWDLQKDSIVSLYQHEDQAAKSVRFTNDGRFFACGTEFYDSKWGYNDTTVRILDFDSGNLVRSFASLRSSAAKVEFSPDNSLIGVEAADGSADVYQTFLVDSMVHPTPTYTMRAPIFFSHDSTLLASGSKDGKINIWNIRRKMLHTILNPELHSSYALYKIYPVGIASVAFSPDGEYIASADDGGKVLIWAASTGRLIWNTRSQFDQSPILSFSRHGCYLAGGGGNTIKIWNVVTRKQVQIIRGFKYNVRACAFSSDNRQIVTADDKDIRLWDLHSGKCLKVFTDTSYSPYRSPVSSVAFDQTGRIIIGGYGDCNGKIILWDIRSGRIIRQFTDNAESYTERTMTNVFKVIPTKDGKRLITYSSDIFQTHPNCLFRIWDISTGIVLNRIGLAQSYSSLEVDVTSDQKYFATGNKYGTVSLWTLPDCHQLFSTSDYPVECRSIAFSPEGDSFATGSHDGTIILWNATIVQK